MRPLGQIIAERLPELQAAAVSMMRDTCRIERDSSDEWVITPNGREVPAPSVVVYEGPCKIATYQSYEQNPEVAGMTETLQRYAVHVPVAAGPFEVGDLITIAASAHRPSSTGRTFRVAALHEKTWQTAQRLLVDEGA